MKLFFIVCLLLPSLLFVESLSANDLAIENSNTVVLAYQDEVTTLDPAIGYDWQNMSIIMSLFDGLLRYKPGTNLLTTDLAKEYTVSNDGLKYTFFLRQNIRFHNGRKLVAEDIKYSIERVINPDTRSPGQNFYHSIKGFGSFIKGSTTEVLGIQVIDNYTISFELSSPDATFLYVLAMHFSSAVPKEVVTKYGVDFSHHPIGTGAFQLQSWKKGQSLTLERNLNYHIENTPKVQSIRFIFGIEPEKAVKMYKLGQVDILGDGLPKSVFSRMINDPVYRNYIVDGMQSRTSYISLNTQIPPLDQLAVRKAINMAINKHQIIKFLDYRAIPTNQILPPGMAGYIPRFKGYQFDVNKARKLLINAGFPAGFETELYCMDTEPNPTIARFIQSDLANIGIRVTVKCLDQQSVIKLGGERGKAPMIWSGGMAWAADFPDPSNFYGPILSCGSAIPGGWNWPWYCNETIEKLARKADIMIHPHQTSKRIALWQDIFTKIMDDAPWVPIFNEQVFILISKRLSEVNHRTVINQNSYAMNLDYIFISDSLKK